ncbi:MAG: glutamine synthetase [Acholeplasmatales bacterium]|nr:glutamine synthetase [Acholeplasmatales bacterium]MBR6288367.1 glutamine synthetase [Acholeplasmatales bacterium]
MYDIETILEYVKEEDIKFIRLAFIDIYGKQKNVSIMPHELEKAFKYGISIDSMAIDGFESGYKSDLFLFPNPDTITILPWRPREGRVIRMFCDIKYPDGTDFICDTRKLLINAINEAKKNGLEFHFGSEIEFYLFKADDEGESTGVTYDKAGYMDIAPDDKGENIRREICLTLEEMDIMPERSHHEEGPGQNEVAFRYSDALRAADEAVTFKTVVKTVAGRNGLYASFNPKPISDKPGNGYHINFSVAGGDLDSAIEGVLTHIKEITAFLNVSDESYERLGKLMAPKYISWSRENRSELIRVPAAKDNFIRAELRSPDPQINPYVAFTLLIYAGMEGILNNYKLRQPVDSDLNKASDVLLDKLDKLPLSLEEAKEEARNSKFVNKYIPKELLENYLK